MSAQERSAALEAEARELDAQVAAMSAEIEDVGEEIKKVIVNDEAAAKKLIKDRTKLAETIDFARFKAAGLKDQIYELRGDVLREKLAEARAVYEEKKENAEKAAARLDLAKSELEQATRDRDIAMSQWSNSGAIVSKLETELFGFRP